MPTTLIQHTSSHNGCNYFHHNLQLTQVLGIEEDDAAKPPIVDYYIMQLQSSISMHLGTIKHNLQTNNQ